MSEQQNVRTVQTIYDAFMRGDVPTIVGNLADTFEWHHRGAPAVPWGISRSTKPQVESFFRELGRLRGHRRRRRRRTLARATADTPAPRP